MTIVDSAKIEIAIYNAEHTAMRIENGDCIMYRIPKSLKDMFVSEPELKQAGDYILFTDKALYVGKGDVRADGTGVLARALQKHTDNEINDNWTDAICITRATVMLNDAHIAYIERMLYEQAKKSRRFKIANIKTPSGGHLSPVEGHMTDQFIGRVALAIKLLGFNPFEKSTTSAPPPPPPPPGELILYLKHKFKDGRIVKATCRKTGDYFYVLAGSQISTVTKSCIAHSTISDQRDGALAAGDVLLHDSGPFFSSSAAGSFVTGDSCQGPKAWKTEDGRTLQDVLDGVPPIHP